MVRGAFFTRLASGCCSVCTCACASMPRFEPDSINGGRYLACFLSRRLRMTHVTVTHHCTLPAPTHLRIALQYLQQPYESSSSRSTHAAPLIHPNSHTCHRKRFRVGMASSSSASEPPPVAAAGSDDGGGSGKHQQPSIGVLALQGAFHEHAMILQELGVGAREVRACTLVVGRLC